MRAQLSSLLSYPVLGVQIVERGRKIHEEKKREETRGGKREGFLALGPPPPSVFPVYNLTRSPLTAALNYLNAWNRLLLSEYG